MESAIESRSIRFDYALDATCTAAFWINHQRHRCGIVALTDFGTRQILSLDTDH